MKKSTLIVAALVLFAFCAPLFAQSFSDVPTDHWAYSAIQELSNKGFVVGYPDGTFGGKRAISRYEFAMAISRVVAQLQPAAGVSNEQFSSLESRVKALESAKPGTVVAPNGSAVTKEDLATVSKLVDSFRDELATLGVDVDAAKKEIADLRTDVDTMKAQLAKLPEISAEGGFIAKGSISNGDNEGPVFDLDGRQLNSTNTFRTNVRSLYSMDLTIKGKIGENSNAVAVFDTGNYLNWLGGVSNAGIAGGDAGANPSDAITPWLVYANTPVSFGKFGEGKLTVGKLPMQLTPYTYKMVDVDSYVSDSKTDSGDYPILGAAMDMKFGPVALTTFAGKNNNNVPLLAGAGASSLDVAKSAGARATFAIPSVGTIGANYVLTGANINEDVVSGQRLAVYGGDINTTVYKGIGLEGSYNHSRYQDKDGHKLSGLAKTNAWDARLNIPVKSVAIQAGYRQIDPDYTAPGFWGKIGPYFNPTDIKGPMASVKVPVTNKLALTAGAEYYKGCDGSAVANAENVLNLTKDDKLSKYTADVKYDLCKATNLTFGWENDKVNYDNSEMSDISWNAYTLGVGHDFNANASLKLMYQFLNQKAGDETNKGDVALTQLSIKF